MGMGDGDRDRICLLVLEQKTFKTVYPFCACGVKDYAYTDRQLCKKCKNGERESSQKSDILGFFSGSWQGSD